MNSEQLVPALIFMTLGAVLIIGIFQFVSIMRKRRQRDNTPLTQHSEAQRREGKGFSNTSSPR